MTRDWPVCLRFSATRRAKLAGNELGEEMKGWRINHDSFSQEKDHNITRKEAGNTTS